MAASSFIRRMFAGTARLIDTLMAVAGRLLFLLLLIVVLMWMFSGPERIQVPDGAALVLAPAGSIVEQSPLADPLSMLLSAGSTSVTLLKDVVDVIDRAAADERISALVLDLEELLSISPANLHTVGAALQRFRDSGKPILAHGGFFSQPQYALASFADNISLHPLGNLLLPGYGGNQLFFAGLLERLKVKVHVFRVGTHKSASEPYARESLSEEARQNNQQLVNELWQHYLAMVAANRSISEGQLRNYADAYPQLLQEVGGDMARLALEQGLIDEVQDGSRFRSSLARRFGEVDGNFLQISHQDYLRATRPAAAAFTDRVAVIVAQGNILMGEQPRGSIGSDSLATLIRRAREADQIKALVLRIDSPGGIAIASEVIRQELALTRAAGKPVVVSMAGTAASGGYWIATAADQIWASPLTITGSIGVTGMLPTFEDSLAEIGITSDGVGTTALSRTGDPLSGLNEGMQQVLQASVEDAYQKFLQLVADSRGMSLEQVDLLAQGQVWSGSQAHELGLVDELGDLPAAIDAAAALAQLSGYQVQYIEQELSTAEQLLLRVFGTETAAQLLLKQLPAMTDAGLPAEFNRLIGAPLVEQLNSSLRRGPGSMPQLFLTCDFCSSIR